MGKRRTRKQKQKAEKRRLETAVYEEKPVEQTIEENKPVEEKQLIIKDLLKTFWVAGVILIILLLTYWFR